MRMKPDSWLESVEASLNSGVDDDEADASVVEEDELSIENGVD